MARLSQLIGAGLLALSGASAHAFVFPAPPPGFAGTPGNWTYAPPSGTQVLDKIMRAPPSLTVPTGSAGNVKLPFAVKLTPAASRIAGAAIFASPHLRFLVGAAAWLAAASLVWDEASQQWKKLGDSNGDGAPSVSDGYEWAFANSSLTGWHKDKSSACQALIGYFSSQNTDPKISFSGYVSGDKCVRLANGNSPVPYDLISRTSSCPAGWYQTPAGCIQTPPPKEVGKEDFLDDLTRNPMPDSVPTELPVPTPLPVHDPVVNPTPGPNPTPQPKFVPTGDPVKNPNYDPKVSPSPTNQPYIQPGIRIQPSPTPTDPWRVDVQPVNRPLPTDNPNPPDPEPGTDPGDQKKPEETQSLCEKHPDILACQKLDQPEAKELAKEDINISITPVSGWGAENAACPAPRSVQVAGRAVEISWQPVCDFATGLRPLVIALAWLSAVSMVIVVARRN